MREILFRGQRVDNGEWVYGCLIYVTDGNTLKRYPNIVISYNHDTFDWHDVIPESVYQFTGLLDKNGNKIFEGKNSLELHIIGLGKGIVDVLMKDGQWQIFSESQGYASLFEMLINSAIELEIIGNIH